MIKPCEKCGKDIHTYPSKIAQGRDKYCSRACSDFTENRTLTLKCGICANEFQTTDDKIKEGRGKYCSMPCYRKSRKGSPAWNKGQPAPWAIGNKHRVGLKNPYLKALNESRTQDANSKWKGNDVGYRALHYWVERQLGVPNECGNCGDISLKTRYHWANLSHQYLRSAKDWVRLCALCHKRYDTGKLKL